MNIVSIKESNKTSNQRFMIYLLNEMHLLLLENFCEKPDCVYWWTFHLFICNDKFVNSFYLLINNQKVSAWDLNSMKTFILCWLIWNLSWMCIRIISRSTVINFKLIGLNFTSPNIRTIIKRIISSLADSVIIFKKMLCSAQQTAATIELLLTLGFRPWLW